VFRSSDIQISGMAISVPDLLTNPLFSQIVSDAVPNCKKEGGVRTPSFFV
jgi:hypothetical protein